MTFPRPSADPPKGPVGTWPLMAMFIVAAALPVILSVAAAPASILLALIAALLATGRPDRIAWWIVAVLIIAVWGYALIRWIAA